MFLCMCSLLPLYTCWCAASGIRANLKLEQSKGHRCVHVLCGCHEFIVALKREYSLLMSDTTIAMTVTNYNSNRSRRSKSA